MADESVSQYLDYLDKKTQGGADTGIEPVWMPEFLFDFQHISIVSCIPFIRN